MATNIQTQHRLDRVKYKKSEEYGADLSGAMPYCFSCEYRADLGCSVSQLDREMNCLCAKAYNNMNYTKGKTKDKTNFEVLKSLCVEDFAEYFIWYDDERDCWESKVILDEYFCSEKDALLATITWLNNKE